MTRRERTILDNLDADLRAKMDAIRAECGAILHKENPYRAAHHIIKIANEVAKPKGE